MKDFGFFTPFRITLTVLQLRKSYGVMVHETGVWRYSEDVVGESRFNLVVALRWGMVTDG